MHPFQSTYLMISLLLLLGILQVSNFTTTEVLWPKKIYNCNIHRIIVKYRRRGSDEVVSAYVMHY